MASFHVLHSLILQQEPQSVSSGQVTALLEQVFEIHQRPRKGVIVGHTVWLSSHELLLDEDTSVQGDFLERNGVCFGPMKYEEKMKITEWAKRLGLAIEFNADNINNYVP